MRKSIWIKGSELRKMTNTQLSKYEFNARITNPDEPSDHELLKQLVQNQASDHKLILALVEKVKKIETNQTNDHELLVKTNSLLLKIIKLNNLKTE